MANTLHTKLVGLSRAEEGSRMKRLARHPISIPWPRVMRKFGLQSPTDVETFWGGRFSGMLPEAVTSLIWRTGYFDRDVCLALINYLKPGSVFVDIGAHFGFFSLLGSHLVGQNGRVMSIEAMPSTYAFFQANIAKNAAHKNVTSYQGAAFDRETELEFTDFGLVASSLNSAFGNRGASSLGTQAKKVQVKARPGDAILSEHGIASVDLIKIDAESSEKFVLSGLSETLRSARPVVVMEVGDIVVEGGAPTAEIINIMNAQGYAPHRWSATGELQRFQVTGPLPYANLMFLPEETRPR